MKKQAKRTEVVPDSEDEALEDRIDAVADESTAKTAQDDDDVAESTSTSSEMSPDASPTFDAMSPSKNASVETASTETSISSSTAPPYRKTKPIKVPADTTALRARLAARIEQLRAARKADKDGQPVRTRQELIESRRVKQAERKARKKELRRQAKIEEDRKREEALASARNSPLASPMVGLGLDGNDDDDDSNANHYAFGRVAFTDGTQMSHDLSYVKDAKKQKGPHANDAKAHLAKLEAQKERLAGMDDASRKDVLEKEAWLAARKRVEGERVRDNESLLKKTIKRKEKAKKKSEREWKDRTKGVENSIKERQKKREENIRKRKDDKLAGKAKKKGIKVKKGRAGFEGTFGGRR